MSSDAGQLLGSVSGALGLRKFLEAGGHELVVTSDKDGPNSELEKHLHDSEIIISQPFWPAYMTRERIAKAKKLKYYSCVFLYAFLNPKTKRMIVTAGIGSDHTDLQAAMDRSLTVAEVTFCNSISVAEHVVMQILALVRNFIPSYQHAVGGGWNIADCVSRSYDVEGMHIGTVAGFQSFVFFIFILKNVLQPVASDWPSCAGSSPLTCICTTPTDIGCRRKWRRRFVGDWMFFCSCSKKPPIIPAEADVPQDCRGSCARVRRGHHQLPAPSRDGTFV